MEVLLGKSSINGPVSIAMLNNQMVIGKKRPEIRSRVVLTLKDYHTINNRYHKNGKKAKQTLSTSWPSRSVINPQATSKWSSAVNSCRSVTCDWGIPVTVTGPRFLAMGSPLLAMMILQKWLGNRKNPSAGWLNEPTGSLQEMWPWNWSFLIQIFWCSIWSRSTNHQQKSIIKGPKKSTAPLCPSPFSVKASGPNPPRAGGSWRSLRVRDFMRSFCRSRCYPLVNVYITMENHHF